MTASKTVQEKARPMIRTCSIWRALEVVGDTPTLLILEAIWLGQRRFDRIRQNSGLQKALISNRLKRLTESGILIKEAYTTSPPRYNYVLTGKGQALYWTSLMLLRWERRWASQENSLMPLLRHSGCGKITSPEPMCPHCKEIVRPQDVTWEEGPGVGWMAPIYSRRRQRRDTDGKTLDTPAIFTEAAELMGDRWAGLILRSIFTHLRKFDEILKDTAIASNILSDRLNWLVETGILEPRKYQDHPERFEYFLTEKGLDYYPVLVMLQKWGDAYYASPEGPPVLLRHKNCGKPLDAYVGCSECKEPVYPQEMTYELVPKKQADKK
ncbi:winged helix-turn-helix transcriptional regulator [Hyphomonas pacifica]|uniref:winged helix-turn-helix transcriptional regulator n=1 Tax=Hyphomonas pacifica TaxID=1280941 RepID=UPI000DBF4BF1|nr:helix-turn-helix domain-containing protein [Hyphomonas pacifica]RAN32683.1 hypothetical protein HY11_17435 [Hyphomonas pacifica]